MAVKKRWTYEAELAFTFADLKREAYDRLKLSAEPDDATDEEINSILDLRGLRQLRGGEWLFDATATREKYLDAVKTGMLDWSIEQAGRELDKNNLAAFIAQESIDPPVCSDDGDPDDLDAWKQSANAMQSAL